MIKKVSIILLFMIMCIISFPQAKLPEMVHITGGTFNMGDNSGGCTVHTITVSSFNISKYEITHKQYISFLNSINCNKDGSLAGIKLIDMSAVDCAIGYRNNQFFFEGCSYTQDITSPVIEITWFGANEYCKWLSRKTNKTYRLPTEAEWEYASGGGEVHQKWSGTNDSTTIADYMWYLENSGDDSQIIGSKKPNLFGLYDMSGSVWEWCSDWYDYNYYSKSPTNNPQGSDTGKYKVTRGGSWRNPKEFCTVAYRGISIPTDCGISIGFRPVCEE